MSAVSTVGHSTVTPCSVTGCNVHENTTKLDTDDDTTNSFIFWLMVGFCIGGIVVNSLGLYIIFVSFVVKEGGRWLAMVGICDLLLCVWVMPFEIYGLHNISTVDMPYGVCFLLTVTCSWISGVSVLTLLIAVLCILGRCLLPRFPEMKKRNWSIVLGVSVLLSMGASFCMLAARSSGLFFYTTPVFTNRAVAHEERTTCTFRDATFLETEGLVSSLVMACRVCILALLFLLTAAASVVLLYMQKRQNGVGVGGVSSTAPKVNVGRLIQVVDTVVDTGVKIDQNKDIKSQVRDILLSDETLIVRVIELYLSEEPVPSAKPTTGTVLLGPGPFGGDMTSSFNSQENSASSVYSKSFLKKPGCSTTPAPPQKHTTTFMLPSSADTDKYALARRASSLPDLSVSESVDGPLHYRSSFDANVHSALTYLYAPQNMQTNLRKEMVYQRALSKLIQRGHRVKQSSQRAPSQINSDSVMPHAESMDYTVSTANFAVGRNKPQVESTIMLMVCVAVVLTLVSLLPLSCVFFYQGKKTNVASPSEAIDTYAWTEIYFLHATIRPIFYFIVVPKFRLRFCFLFCRCCCRNL